MKRILSLILVIASLGTLVPVQAATFTDVPEGHQYYVPTEFLKSQNVIQGYEDGSFRPDQKLNRAEALKVILVGSNLEVPETTERLFPDVKASEWYAKYINYAKKQSIINGNDDGTFAPGRTVSRAEFLKMVLTLNRFKKENWEGRQLYDDVSANEWYTPYMNFAGNTGIIRSVDSKLDPNKELTRGEISEIMYLLYVILNGKNTNFLLGQAEKHIIQIERYMEGNDAVLAKRASELAVDFTQQAYVLKPEDPMVLSLGKVAKAYDYVVTAFIAGVQKNKELATEFANKAIDKATEAWEVNNEMQSVAAHIKSRARSIIDQL